MIFLLKYFQEIHWRELRVFDCNMHELSEIVVTDRTSNTLPMIDCSPPPQQKILYETLRTTSNKEVSKGFN